MPLSALGAIAIGAALGAWLRWGLGLLLNPILPALPLGTLAANTLGGYMVGIAVAFFAHNAAVPPEVKLFVITGFLGGLTTFSTFSAEAVALLTRAEYGWAATHILGHLVLSIAMTFLGIFTVNWARG